jgi:3-isopropylmalate/(R)-2-methylmalate dehydratase small subunit
VRNLTQGTQLAFEPLPRADLEMLEAGGLESYLKKRFFSEKNIGASA